MHIGLPKETKPGERRIALAPEAVGALTAGGNEVILQSGAGLSAGHADADYSAHGARIVASAEEAYACEMVVKVKEIQPEEWKLLQDGCSLLGFLHLGGDAAMCRELLARRVTGIAYETITGKNGSLPVLEPMSRLAGMLAVSIGQHGLLAPQGGRGVLLADARVVIFGAGIAAKAAAEQSLALGAQVTVASRAGPRLQALPAGVRAIDIATADVSELVRGADLVIAAVHTSGEATPRLLSRGDVGSMGTGAMLIEIGIDAGGIAETSRPTTHLEPTYVAEGVTHYCVANMPAAVPRSASAALSAAVLPYVSALANHGLAPALRQMPGLAAGLQMHGGHMLHAAIAARHGFEVRDLDAILYAC